MKRRKESIRRDHTETAFMVAFFAAGAGVSATEWVYYQATDVAFWDTWRLHPLSAFIGTLCFVCCLYGMQVLNGRRSPLRFLQPYTPLLGASGINVALRRNSLWLIPFAVLSIVWSVLQVRGSRR